MFSGDYKQMQLRSWVYVLKDDALMILCMKKEQNEDGMTGTGPVPRGTEHSRERPCRYLVQNLIGLWGFHYSTKYAFRIVWLLWPHCRLACLPAHGVYVFKNENV